MSVRSLFSAMILITGVALQSQAGTLAQDLSDVLVSIKSVYQTAYAPAEWKKKFFGYDLQNEFEKAQTAINSKPEMTQGEAQRILKDFVYATRDYHTSISFLSTATASLPFLVEGIGDQFFIVYIDREKLPESSFPFRVGDQLISFNGKPTLDVVRELQADTIGNVESTDRALATRNLTRRMGYRGGVMPSGPVDISVLPKGQTQAIAMQLIWDSTPELIQPRTNFSLVNQGVRSSVFNPIMVSPQVDEGAAGNPYQIGGRKTFTPDLGVKVWESDETNDFHAYIYKTADRKLIGYLRLPSYISRDYNKSVADFAKIIGRFETVTDSMIIDQVNNPGGSVFYLYALASMLTDHPLVAPRHRMTITQKDVSEALEQIAKLKDVKNDADAQKAFPIGDLSGYPASYEFARFYLSCAQFIVSEWNAGRRLTTPYWIGGVDHINPAPVHYSKPILVLINNLDFSGGDFFPTILQDNHRATIMGARTAGAGGYILGIDLINNIGVESFSVTGSIAERVDGNPIENLGVVPEIPYTMTPEDYTNNYGPYVQAIQNAINSITP